MQKYLEHHHLKTGIFNHLKTGIFNRSAPVAGCVVQGGLDSRSAGTNCSFSICAKSLKLCVPRGLDWGILGEQELEETVLRNVRFPRLACVNSDLCILRYLNKDFSVLMLERKCPPFFLHQRDPPQIILLWCSLSDPGTAVERRGC